MPHQLFLSHDSRDRERADAIAHAITRMTLGQITVWHSSDSGASGGLKPGHVWLDEIRSRLASSRAVVALLTPTSLARPWLLFESGFGAANASCDVIPVCVGIDRLSDVPFPLAMYQTYQLSDYDSLKRFAEKLLAKYEIHFDEEMARPVLLDALKSLGRESASSQTPIEPEPDPSLAKAVSDLKEHIDKRLIGLLSSSAPVGDSSTELQFYTFPIELNQKGVRKVSQFIEIGSDTSVQDVLDNVYYMLEGKVEPYMYLQKWVLRELESGVTVIIREIQSRIPAKLVFTPGSKWEVVWLKRPYAATDSIEWLAGEGRGSNR